MERLEGYTVYKETMTESESKSHMYLMLSYELYCI